MTFDFPLILLVLTVFTGVITVVDLVFAVFTKRSLKSTSVTVEYARSFFPVLLLVLLIRSFAFQPYRVPTGSLEPTIMPGDFILVNQYDYGLRLPVWHTKFYKTGEPKVGQIGLFRFPVNPKVTFVKRVIGVPGDHISYINKVLYINGKKQPQVFIKEASDEEGPFNIKVKLYEETLNGVKHDILVNPERPTLDFYNIVVPKGEYFMMGDNRDDSEDSRYWGFVPENDFIGKALFVWFSWNSHTDSITKKIRWDRIGTSLTK